MPQLHLNPLIIVYSKGCKFDVEWGWVQIAEEMKRLVELSRSLKKSVIERHKQSIKSEDSDSMLYLKIWENFHTMETIFNFYNVHNNFEHPNSRCIVPDTPKSPDTS